MKIKDSNKLRALRLGIPASALALSTVSISPTAAQTPDNHVIRQETVAQNTQEIKSDTLQLSPEQFSSTGAEDSPFLDFAIQAENATSLDAAYADFKAISDMTEFTEAFKTNPQAFGKPGKLRLSPTIAFISNADAKKIAQSENKINNPKLSQLSKDDYASVCAAKQVEKTIQKLMALKAMNMTDKAEEIYKGFNATYGDKIQVSSINVSMQKEDYQKLKEDILENFHSIHPNFSQDIDNFWQSNHDFNIPEISINDNQFINIALTKFYDVTNAENRNLAKQSRETFEKIASPNTQNSNLSKDKSHSQENKINDILLKNKMQSSLQK